MREYLKHAIRIESLVYEQELVVSKLQRTINELKNYSYEKKIKKHSMIELLFVIPCCGILAGFIGGTFSFFKQFFSFEPMKTAVMMKHVGTGALKWALSTMGIIFLIGTVFILFSNMSASKENKVVEKNNKSAHEINYKKLQRLTKEIEVAKRNLKTIYDIRKRFYDQNIIHSKYRNLIAVCSFYEYFETGRCNTLTGHEGAYNIYENEMRLNRIICQLDVVIAKLDQIRDTQHELYCAVNKCNENISNLNVHLQSIAENSAITAYNSRITARNTEEMKWIMRLK